MIKQKTNLSDDMLSSKIGSIIHGNNSSEEYAVGAISFQEAAIRSGILDSVGANIENINHLDGVEIVEWNSSSSFSTTSENNQSGSKNERRALADDIGALRAHDATGAEK